MPRARKRSTRIAPSLLFGTLNGAAFAFFAAAAIRIGLGWDAIPASGEGMKWPTALTDLIVAGLVHGALAALVGAAVGAVVTGWLLSGKRGPLSRRWGA